MKINLQILDSNQDVELFYLANGYQTEKRISMGKRLPQHVVELGFYKSGELF
jgi:hypothetical protein